MIRRLVRDESGITMGLTVIMVVLIGVMGAGLLTFVMTDLKSVVESNRGQKALDIAEAGVQVAKSHLRQDSFRQHYDTDRANDCLAVYETFTDEDGNPVEHEPGGTRTGGANWSKATDIWTDTGGDCVGTSTRTNDTSTPWPDQFGVTKCFPDSDCSAAGTGRFHVTIECYDQQFGDLGGECIGGARDTSGALEAAPEANVPSSDRKFFKITSTGYDNTAGDSAIRKVEAIYYTSKKGHLPIAFFTPNTINFAGQGTVTVTGLSMFAGGNITGTQSGNNTPIAERCTPALHRDWNAPPYNTVPRVATSDPCPAQPNPPEGANAITGAGFGAVGLVCGTAQCSSPADSVADGRNDFDSTTETKAGSLGKKFVYKEDASGSPDPRRTLASNEISFPFDPGTALEPRQAHTIIGEDLQNEMAQAAKLQGNYKCFNMPGCPTETTHTINTTDWPTQNVKERIIYFVDGVDTEFKVSADSNGNLPRGVLIVRGGNLKLSNANNVGFQGIIIVVGDGTTTGAYDQGGQVRLDGYVSASGTMTLNGTINPSTSIDYTNLNTFRDVRLWSWRELYQQ